MSQTKLAVSLRERTGKGAARKIRAGGRIPGVLYGKGMENTLIEVDPKQVELIFSNARQMNQLLSLEVPGKGDTIAILKEYQADHVTRKFTHLDFLKIDLTQKLHVEVPIEIVGKAEGVKEGGILEIIRREITVICLPTAIPKSIPIDVTSLKIGQSIHIDQLKFPEGVEAPHGVDFTLVSVVAPKEEKAPTAAEGALKEPEVLTAKKPAEGEEAKDQKKEGKSDKK